MLTCTQEVRLSLLSFRVPDISCVPVARTWTTPISGRPSSEVLSSVPDEGFD